MKTNHPYMRSFLPPKLSFIFLLALWSGQLLATPACPIITGSFPEANGVTSDVSSATGWYLDASKLTSPTYFAVKSHRIKAENLGAEGVWYSNVFSVAGYSSFQVDTKITAEGLQTSAEYVKLYYIIDGGTPTLFGQNTGNFGSILFTSAVLTGHTVQLMIKIYDFANGSSQTSKYYIEQFDVFKEAAPCAVTSITVGASAGNSGVLTCTNPSLTLSASTTATGTTTWSWTGPNSFTSTAQNPVVTNAGTYTVVGTNSAGTGSASVTVTSSQAAPNVTASGGTITCSGPSVTLSGTSTTSGVSYSWTGPGSFTSAAQNPAVSTAGVYTLTVTITSTGCTASDTANVFLNNTLPVVTASASSVLTCTATSVTLTGSSTPSTGVSYSWTGPNSFTSTAQNPAASTAGIYTLTVTNTATGCTGSDTANLAQNKVLPVVVASATGVLTCNNPAITLSGSFTPSTGVSFGWTGPTGFTSAIQNPTITAGGIYTLTVTITATGCSGSDTANAIVNTTPPGASATVSGTLNCRDTVVTLSGSSPTAGVSFSWTGPNGFSSTVQNPTVKNGGNYVLTVTSPINGCSSTTGVAVSQDTAHPANMTAAISSTAKQLDCNNNNVFLQGGTTTTGVNYSWSGPNGFSVTATGTMVFNPGQYTFTAVNPTNFCSASASVTVVQDLTPPANLTAQPALSQLTCVKTSSTIVASSTTTGVSYAWSGPNGFSSSSNSITVATPGNYTVLLTNPASGCTNNTLVQVSQNITPPANVVASTLSGSTQLTCTNSSLTLSGSAAAGNISYAWTGPNGFSASTPNATASAAGTYTLTATNNTNGCTAAASVALQANTAAPAGVASTPTPASGLLSCTTTSVQLNASSTTTTVRYSWSGPNSFTASVPAVAVQAPGTYTLTATDTTNGCSATTTAVITQNTAAPVGLTATVNQQLTCLVTTVNLAGSSTTPGVNYSWTGPNGFTATTANTQTGKGGTYTLHVTNPTNGCSQTLPLTVSQNIAPPANVTATNSGPLTCNVTQVTLTGTTSTVNAGFEWDGPNSYQSFSAQDVATDPGSYVLTVTNFDNGCTLLDTTIVQYNCGPARRMTNGTDPANSAATTGGAFAFKAYPNPFSNKAVVTFQSPETAFVTVRLFNSTGILEKLLFNDKANAGQLYTLPFTGTFAAGMHYIVISVNNKIYTKQLISVQ